MGWLILCVEPTSLRATMTNEIQSMQRGQLDEEVILTGQSRLVLPAAFLMWSKGIVNVAQETHMPIQNKFEQADRSQHGRRQAVVISC